MRTGLPYRIIAATLSLLMVAGIVMPVVQAACAADMQVDVHAHHAYSVASANAEGMQASASHTHESNHVTSVNVEPSEATPSPCSTGCETCCIVEAPLSTWTTIRVIDHLSWKGDVPPRYDVVTIIMPRDGDQSPQYLASDASPPVSPVRLHVWTATFLT